MAVIIAAGALFTAVYDVLKRSDLSHTNSLNAVTTSNQTGKNVFEVTGVHGQGNEQTTVTMDNAVYMMIFWGQNAYPYGYGSLSESTYFWRSGYGAVCLAFYKGNSMTVTVGKGGGSCNANPSDKSDDSFGGGATVVSTNLARPDGYTSMTTATASGGGGGSNRAISSTWAEITDAERIKLLDGTFAGWEGNDWGATMQNVLGRIPNASANLGTPATQSHGGFKGAVGQAKPITPNGSGYGGGGGYYEGGGSDGSGSSDYLSSGGGGSCSPNCYPLMASDLQNGPTQSGTYHGFMRSPYTSNGGVKFYKITPTTVPSGQSKTWSSSVSVTLQNAGGEGPWTPKSAVKNSSNSLANYDCGINVGWVYQVSEDGGSSWYGVQSDKIT